MKCKYIVLVLSIIFPLYGFGMQDTCSKSSSYCIYKNNIINNISGHYATLVLDNMEVTNLIKGNYGSIQIGSSKINSIDAHMGSLYIKNSIFNNSIKGGMAAIYVKNSILQDFNASVHKVYLKDSAIDNIKIKNHNHDMSIRLYGKSTIFGNVEFIRHRGRVCLYDEMSEIKGKVINGEIIKGKCEEKWDDWNE